MVMASASLAADLFCRLHELIVADLAALPGTEADLYGEREFVQFEFIVRDGADGKADANVYRANPLGVEYDVDQQPFADDYRVSEHSDDHE